MCILYNTCFLFRDTPVVIEWKKSSRDKSSLNSTYDAPIQLAAYMGAVNNDISYDFKVSKTQFSLNKLVFNLKKKKTFSTIINYVFLILI